MKATLTFFILTLVFFSVSFTLNGYAQDAFWEKVGGPSAAYLTTIVQAEDGGILAGSPGGVYRSVDQGMTWQKPESGPGAVDIWGLDVAPDGRVFAATLAGLFHSEDGGQVWEKVDAGGVFEKAIDVEVLDSGTIYVAAEGAVYSTEDTGGPWMLVGDGLVEKGVRFLEVDAGGNVFAGTTGEGVYRFLGGSNSWEEANIGLTSPFIRSLLVDNQGILWAGTSGSGVYSSEDLGSTWQVAGVDLPSVDVRALIEVNDVLYAGASSGEDEDSRGGIFRLQESANSWTTLDLGENSGAEIRSILSLKNGELIAGTAGQQIYRSSNEGDSWDTYEVGLTNSIVHNFKITTDGHLFAGTVRVGFYMSVDRGDSWRSIDIGDTERIDVLAEAPDGSLVAATQKRNIYRSVDGGLAWENIGSESDAEQFGFYPTISAHVTQAGTIMIAGYDSKIMRSEDNGETWTLVEIPVVRDPGNGSSENVRSFVEWRDGTLFTTVFGRGVFRSFDDGITWEAINSGLQSLDTSLLAGSQSGDLYLGIGTEWYFTDEGEYAPIEGAIYRSQDGGENWEWFYGLPPAVKLFDSRNVRSIVVTPEEDVFVSVSLTENGGESESKAFFYSAISESWSEMIVPSPKAAEFALDNRGYLYAGTFGEGIYRSKEAVSLTLKATSTEDAEVPDAFVLEQNYPNPFNPTTTIQFSLPAQSDVTLTVFDMLGRKIQVVHQGPLRAGGHEMEFDATGLPSGIYLYRLNTPEKSLTNTMLLLK